MHFSTIAFAAVATSAVSAQMSICDKYTTALLMNNTAANQYTLLTLLVNTAVIGNYTGPGTTNAALPGSMVNVPGILAPGEAEGQQVNLLPYFSGALVSSNRGNMPVAINNVDGGGAEAIMADPTSAGAMGSNQQRLFTHLYQYFGQLLGCSQYGMMGFPAYTAAPSQYNVHKYMALNHAEVTYFIQQVGMAASSFGASDDDVNTVAMTLGTAFNYRCSPATELIPGQGAQFQSICSDESCPLDPQSTCAAYPQAAVVSEPASASMTASSATMTGQPTAATSATVSQISDGQPQAPTSAGTAMATPAMYTGAAAAANALPAVAGGVAGLVALFL